MLTAEQLLLAASSDDGALQAAPLLLSSLPTSGLMVTSAMPELMSSSSMDRRPLPPSLHGTCRLSGLIYGLRPCLTQQASRRTPLCWSLANRASSGRMKGHGRSTVGLTRARGTTILLGPPDPYGLVGLVQTVYAYYFAVHTSHWQLPEAPLPLTLGPQDLSAVLRPLEATSWADVPLALQIQNPEGRTVLLRLTLKRRKLPHPSFDPMSEFPIYPRVTGAEANHCFWGYCGSRTNRTFAWYGTNQHGAFIRICNTTPKIRLRLPHTGCEEVFQDGYRLVLLPKLAFYALWDGHGESFVVPRAATGVAEVALPIGSYASAPVDNSDPHIVALASRAFLQPR